MLWEPSDPADVLRSRFGFDDAEAVVGWVGSALERHWGLRVDGCERIVMSDANALAWVRTPGGPMVLKWSIAVDRFPRLAALARLTRWLDEQRLPVSAPVVGLAGAAQLEVDGVSLGLQHVVDGDLLDTTDAAEVRAAGATLARLHDALAACPGADRLRATLAPFEPLADRVLGWLGTAGDHVPAPVLDAVRAMATTGPDLPGVQVVHGDFRSGNVLCRGGDVAAVLDLEEARLDHAVVELARSAVLLGTRFHDWGPVSPEVRAQLLAGYESVRALTPAEAAWWDVLVLWHSWAMTPAGADPTGWRSAALGCATELGLGA